VADQNRVNDFYQRLITPINAITEKIENRDEVIYRLMGALCTVYGAFILLLMLIPNSMRGRICFLFVGGVITVSGMLLYRRSMVLAKRHSQQIHAPGVSAIAPVLVTK